MRLLISTRREEHQLSLRYRGVEWGVESLLGPFIEAGEGLENEDVDAALGTPADLQSLFLDIVCLNQED